jgi:hypothetical protein
MAERRVAVILATRGAERAGAFLVAGVAQEAKKV